ncbi:MAG: hypothetical protein Q9159_006574 [Coniocarpon cinnabarinum]
MASNVSEDLIWEITNKHNSYTHKQRSGNRVLLSRDPLNLTNKHSRKYAGVAIGVQAAPPTKDGPSKGIVVTTKKPGQVNHPSKDLVKTQYAGSTSGRRIYRGIANATAKRGYRPDLRREAIARASQIKRSQGKPRVAAEKKPRGKKAKKALEKEASGVRLYRPGIMQSGLDPYSGLQVTMSITQTIVHGGLLSHAVQICRPVIFRSILVTQLLLAKVPYNMPSRIRQNPAEDGFAVRQIIASNNDGDFLDHLVEGMRSTNHNDLLWALDKLCSDRDHDIEYMCTHNAGEFVGSVNKLDKAREDCTSLGNDILNLVQSYQDSTDNLAEQKKNLVDSKNVRQNIDESAEALKECLEVLRLANQVHDLVAKQNHYAALRALDELQSLLRVRESARYKIGELIEKSIPATQKMIAEAVMSDLNTWLYRIRDVSQYIGEVAFFHTEQRRTRQRERAAADPGLAPFKLNSPLELVADETEEYDVLNDDEAELHVDFTPLFEAIHIHEALGQSDRFRSEYAVTRRRQKDLIVPLSLKIDDEEASELKTMLESIAGFAIVERETVRRTDNLRASVDVDELWDSMSQSAITMMSSAVLAIEDAEMLLKLIGVISLFVQTMETLQFFSQGLHSLLMSLFEKYIHLLKRRCADDFSEILATDDYMPMSMNSPEDYEKVMDVVWYTPEVHKDALTFPVVLPFSQMYPMCCHDVRSFLSQVYSAPEDYISRSSQIDDAIRDSLDELLGDRICEPLLQRLSSRYPGIIVQILTNLEHFESTCERLQVELGEQRTSRSRTGPIVLRATQAFRDGKEQAKRRIFELVNSKVAELIETAEYDWSTRQEPQEPSEYMTALTRWLSNTMSSVLLGIPTEVKDMIYFDALSQASSDLLELPLESSVTMVTPAALQRLSLDVTHLANFVSSLTPSSNPNRSFPTAIAPLVQSVALMLAGPEKADEFYDLNQRNVKYAAVDPQMGPQLLDKVDRGSEVGVVGVGDETAKGGAGLDRFKASERFAGVMNAFRGVGRVADSGES